MIDERVYDKINMAFLTMRLMASIIGLLLGLFLIFINLISLYHAKTYVKSTASIVDVYYNEEYKEYIPVYEYNVEGKIVRADGIGTKNEDEYVIGTSETIWYNPKNYKQFDIGDRKASWFSWVLSIVLLVASINFVCRYIKITAGLKENNYELYQKMAMEQKKI